MEVTIDTMLICSFLSNAQDESILCQDKVWHQATLESPPSSEQNKSPQGRKAYFFLALREIVINHQTSEGCDIL